MTDVYKPIDENAFLSEGLRRRAVQKEQIAARDAAPADIIDPHANSWVGQTSRSVVQGALNSAHALEGLGRKMIGDDEGAARSFDRFNTREEEIRRLGPRIQSFDDASKAGGSVGDYGAAVGYTAASMIPDLAMSLTGAGVGAAIGRRAGKSLVEGQARKQLREFAEQRGVRDQMEREATREALLRGTPNAMRVGRASAGEALEMQIKRSAAAATGRTPADLAVLSRARKIGLMTGGAAGGFPGMSTENVDILSEEGRTQGDALKAFVGTAAASVIGALPFERFLGRFGSEAVEQARKNGEKFLPRVAKEFGKQGTAEGSAEVAQTATQLASHKWIDDNIDMLSPEALDGYLASFAGGFIAGGSLGAAGETGRAGVDKMDALLRKVGTSSREMLASARDRLKAYAAARREAIRSRAGERMGAAEAPEGEAEVREAPAATGTAYDRMKQAMETMSGAARTAYDRAKEAGVSVAERAGFRMNDMADDDWADQALSEIAEMGLQAGEGGPLTPVQNVRNITGDRFVDSMLSRVNPDHPLWQDKDAAKGLAGTFTRLAEGKLTSSDNQLLSQLQDDPDSGVDERSIKVWQAAAPMFKKFSELTSKQAGTNVEDGDNADSGADQYEGIEDQGEGDVVNNALTERASFKDAAGATTSPGDRLANADVAYQAALENPRESIPGVQRNADELNVDAETAWQDLRVSLLGSVDGKSGKDALVVENKIGNGPREWARIENEIKTKASRIEIEPVKFGKQDRRRSLSLDSLVLRYMGQMRPDYKNTPNGNKEWRRAALFKVFADLRLAGIKVKPESITDGDLGYSKDGELWLGRIDDRDAKELRAMLAEKPAATARGRVAQGIKARFDGEQVEGRLDLEDLSANREEEIDREYSRDDKVELQDESKIDSGKDHDRFKLRARTQPAGTKLSDGGDYVSSTSVVSEAVVRDKQGERAIKALRAARERSLVDETKEANAGGGTVTYRGPKGGVLTRKAAMEKQLENAKAALDSAETEKDRRSAQKAVDAAERTLKSLSKKADRKAKKDGTAKWKRDDPRFEAGLQIGLDELRAKFEADAISEEQYNAAIDELGDIETGAAQDYFERALAGEFAKAKATDAKIDEEEPDFEGQRKENEEYGERATRGVPFRPGIRQGATEVNTGIGKFNRDPKTGELKNQGAPITRIAPEVDGDIRSNPDGIDTSRAQRASERRNIADVVPTVKTKLDTVEGQELPQTPEHALGKKLNRMIDKLFKEPIDKAGSENTKAEEGRLTDMANALLEALGFSHRITARLDMKLKGKGRATVNEILINPRIKGAERVTVALHETGHHVVYAAIAKEAGVDPADVPGGIEALDMLAKANPELHAALMEDFEAWKAKTAGMPINDVRDSRHPLPLRTTGQKYGKNSKWSDPEYLYDVHEWLADNIARALLNQKPSNDIVKGFFGRIAEVIQRAWRMLTASEREQWTAAPSVDAWVRDMFSGNRAAVKQVTGSATTKKAADNAVKAGVATKAAKKRQSKSKGLTKEEAEADAATRQGARDRHAAIKTERRARHQREDAARGRSTPPPSDPPKTESAGSPPEPPSDNNSAWDIDEDGVWQPNSLEALMDFVRNTMNPETRNTLEAVLKREKPAKRLREMLEESGVDVGLLDDAKSGMEYRIAYGYIAWLDGRFKTGSDSSAAFASVFDDLTSIARLAGKSQVAHQIFSDMADGTIQRVAKERYDATTRNNKLWDSKRQRVFNKASQVYERAVEPLSKIFTSRVERMFNSGIPAMRELAALIQKPHGATGDDQGLLPAVRRESWRRMREATRVFDGLSPKDRVTAIDMLQRQVTEETTAVKKDGTEYNVWNTKKPEVQAAVRKMREVMDGMYAYLDEAGVRKENGEKIGYQKNFFPVLFDYQNPSVRETLTRLYSQPKFEQHIRAAFSTFNEKTGKRTPSKEKIEKLVQQLVDGAVGDEFGTSKIGSHADDGTPNFHGRNFRISEFVYKHGDAADIKAFASTQTKNFEEALSRYFEPAIKSAELARRTPNGVEPIFARMKKQGATDAQIQEARDILAAALGNYGLDGSPTLAKISPTLAQRFSGDKTKATIQNLQAYQNLRLLPLSLLSSVVDPMGIAVRTGGDFSVAAKGFVQGVRAMFNKSTREELHAMLESLGPVDDIVPAIALGQQFAGRESKLATAVNEGVFKWNGMQYWVRSTRYMALHSAHSFLLKHSKPETATEHSARYLRELGVSMQDIKLKKVKLPDGRVVERVKLLTDQERAALPKDSPKLARDDRVRDALSQFVNEAILKPNPQQTPLWHSDPYMGLLTQYKSFAYAMWDQIAGRIGVEFNNGNLRVLAAAMSYLPIVIVAELIREFIQHGTDGNPRRKDWGVVEYGMLGVDRAGFFDSPRYSAAMDAIEDANRGQLPGSSMLGPSLGQAKQAVTARDYGKTFESALPASAGWKHWNDGEAANDSDGLKRRSGE